MVVVVVVPWHILEVYNARQARATATHCPQASHAWLARAPSSHADQLLFGQLLRLATATKPIAAAAPAATRPTASTSDGLCCINVIVDRCMGTLHVMTMMAKWINSFRNDPNEIKWKQCTNDMGWAGNRVCRAANPNSIFAKQNMGMEFGFPVSHIPKSHFFYVKWNLGTFTKRQNPLLAGNRIWVWLGIHTPILHTL